MVELAEVGDADVNWLRERIARHAALTGSPRARSILAKFDPAAFVKIVPRKEPLKDEPQGEPIPLAMPVV